MYMEDFGRDVELQLPQNKLAITRSDLLQYPYLEKLHCWAWGVRYYSFGSSMMQEYGLKEDRIAEIIDTDSANAVDAFTGGRIRFHEKYTEAVVNNMNTIGYDISNVDVKSGFFSSIDVRLDDYILYATEKDRNTTVTQNAISQGMFRALAIIIHITRYAMWDQPTTILIDDIGEGLDFERSTKLIKLLIGLAENSKNIQLIMSTNDRYVMNNVPLEYWQVIQRKGGECSVFNCRNRKKQFDELKYTGLNNFDFLATDFINKVFLYDF